MKRFPWMVIALACIPTSLLAANKVTASLAISAKVDANCVVNAGTLNFGTYDPFATTDLNGSGTFTVACTRGTSAAIDLDNGVNLAGGWRQMLGGGDSLKYALYKDSARTQVWGTGLTGGTTNAYNATSKAAATLTVYGTIPQGQDVTVATLYSDSVLITVNY